MDKRFQLREQRRKMGVKAIYARRPFKEAIKEAQLAEDDDLMPVVQVPEECPTCKNEDELISFIRNCTVSRAFLWLVIHCTGTPLQTTVQSILNFWRNVQKWINPGYHILFLPDGSFTVTADFDTICNGVKGFNANSIHLSWIGGIDDKGKPVDNMTPQQEKMVGIAIREITNRWPQLKTKYQGHHDFPNVNKACPCFNTKQKFPIL